MNVNLPLTPTNLAVLIFVSLLGGGGAAVGLKGSEASLFEGRIHALETQVSDLRVEVGKSAIREQNVLWRLQQCERQKGVGGP